MASVVVESSPPLRRTTAFFAGIVGSPVHFRVALPLSELSCPWRGAASRASPSGHAFAQARGPRGGKRPRLSSHKRGRLWLRVAAQSRRGELPGQPYLEAGDGFQTTSIQPFIISSQV